MIMEWELSEYEETQAEAAEEVEVPEETVEDDWGKGEVEVVNNRPGWSREITYYDNGTRYIVDSKITDDWEYEYHEYNITPDNLEHTHIHGKEGKFLGGHGFEKRPWHD